MEKIFFSSLTPGKLKESELNPELSSSVESLKLGGIWALATDRKSQEVWKLIRKRHYCPSAGFFVKAVAL